MDFKGGSSPYYYSVKGVPGNVDTVLSHDWLVGGTVPPGSITNKYVWPTPPATAPEGGQFPASITQSVVNNNSYAQTKPYTFFYRFDYADIPPGSTSGWNYTGIGIGGWDGPKTWQGTLVFPNYSATASHQGSPGKIRLQAETENFAVQYVYTWVNQAPAPAPVPAPAPTTDPTPAAPQNVMISAVNAKKADISWQAPATGSPLRYKVYVSAKFPGKRSWGAWKSTKVGATQLSVRTKFSKRGVKARAYVKALFDSGWGPASSTVVKRLPRR